MHGLYPPPAALAETADGTLLVVLLWTESQPTPDGTGTMYDQRTRLLRLAPDGTQTFVRPFGELKPGSDWERYTIEDEILPLADASMLFGSYNAIDVQRPDGSIARFAGTGLYHESSSGDGGPALVARMSFPRGLARAADGSILFGDGNRVRRIAPEGIITTVAGRDGGQGRAATVARRPLRCCAPPTTCCPRPTAGSSSPRRTAAACAGSGRTVSSRPSPARARATFSRARATAARPWRRSCRSRSTSRSCPTARCSSASTKAVRRVAADGTIITLLQLPEGDKRRMGELRRPPRRHRRGAGGDRGGRDRRHRLGPPAARALSRPREHGTHAGGRPGGARGSQRKVGVTVRTSRPGRLRLEVSRRGKVVAKASRTGTGRAAGDLRRRPVRRRVPRRARDPDRREGRGARRRGARLHEAARCPSGSCSRRSVQSIEHCDRITARRIDCEHHIEEDEEDGRNCLDTYAYRLFSGAASSSGARTARAATARRSRSTARRSGPLHGAPGPGSERRVRSARAEAVLEPEVTRWEARRGSPRRRTCRAGRMPARGGHRRLRDGV